MREAIEDLLADYAEAIDDGALERWPQLFTEDGEYHIITRENHEAGLPIGIMYCGSRGMMEDPCRHCAPPTSTNRTAIGTCSAARASKNRRRLRGAIELLRVPHCPGRRHGDLRHRPLSDRVVQDDGSNTMSRRRGT